MSPGSVFAFARLSGTTAMFVVDFNFKQCLRCHRARRRDQVAGHDGWERGAGSHSRGAMRPGFAFHSTPSRCRGRREDRVRAAPAVSCAKCTKESAHEHTGSAEAIRPSLRSGFTAYFALSPVTGLCCHRHPRDTSRELSASIGAPGPHDFAVRAGHVRRSWPSRPPHLTATSVTIASRPSFG